MQALWGGFQTGIICSLSALRTRWALPPSHILALSSLHKEYILNSPDWHLSPFAEQLPIIPLPLIPSPEPLSSMSSAPIREQTPNPSSFTFHLWPFPDGDPTPRKHCSHLLKPYPPFQAPIKWHLLQKLCSDIPSQGVFLFSPPFLPHSVLLFHGT